jgi:rubrerythrin
MNSSACAAAIHARRLRKKGENAMPGSQDAQLADRSAPSRLRAHMCGGVSRRRFLIGLMFASAGVLAPNSLASLAQPVAASPHLAQADAPCAETMQRVLDLAVTAEALAITFYQRVITTPGGLFSRLRADQQGYLRLALDEENFHYNYLIGRGAQPIATAFYFPANAFGFSGFPIFLTAMDTIETAAVGLYLVAARRMAELAQPVLAEVLAQILGVEAEHRAIGRELAQNAPPPPNNLCFEPATAACVSWAFEPFQPFLTSGANRQGPFDLPSAEAIAAAVGGFTCTPAPAASAAGCQESIANILNTAATAEALGITFYYQGIQSSFFPQLSQAQQWYLQAALDEERNHLNFLQSQGALPSATNFFFPDSAFSDKNVFLSVLDVLENLFIGAYLAATRRFAELGQPILAEIAAQIMGVEAEHRILGRIMAAEPKPHDLCMQRAQYTCLNDAGPVLAGFLQAAPGNTQPAALPTEAAINSAIERFGCTPVAVAAGPSLRYLPLVRH